MIIHGRHVQELFSADAIAAEVERIAEEIAAHTPGDNANLMLVSVLKGAFVFTADLMRALHRVGIAPEVEFISLSSYGAGTSGGEVRLFRDIERPVDGRDVILVEDILESGRTVDVARKLMLERGARSVRVAVLLDKPGHRKVAIEADHVGFVCPDKFVVGYGLDAAYRFRELPFVGYLTED
ncbi:hypoxanthine phosphoribosyltransferase [Fulvimarina sp. 2208YS6-2-32]|uniref:Hypoxanthine phosphoribosyltransferase n=1 Tax=Fulvimarina uroteuthidis TaxID=3098149 RepID=A0ABU5I185_9HYPH|nr:hypoxanthine phosphoribosyltransferase [Fulvimarina sp. 2208YS6-2-32]MDY8108518.1 hypoxanthine phosphoribosyltransferase [Fulvimarina sp. 2208YS6-2-32]